MEHPGHERRISKSVQEAWGEARQAAEDMKQKREQEHELMVSRKMRTPASRWAAEDDEELWCACQSFANCLFEGTSEEIVAGVEPMLATARRYRYLTCPYHAINEKGETPSPSPVASVRTTHKPKAQRKRGKGHSRRNSHASSGTRKQGKGQGQVHVDKPPDPSAKKKRRRRRRRRGRRAASAITTATSAKPNIKYVPWPIWSFENKDFAQYGLGLMLYFKLLRSLCLLFLALSLAIGFPLVFICTGGDYDTESIGLERTSLGNLVTPVNRTTIDVYDGEVPQDTLQKVFGYLDVAMVPIFLFGLWLINLSHENDWKTFHERQLTASRYSVQFWGLPSKELTRAEVRDFFEGLFGEVVDVSIVYNDAELTHLFAQRGRLKQQLREHTANLQHVKAQDVQVKVYDIDREIQRCRNTLPPIRAAVCAFVTFQERRATRECLRAYRHSRSAFGRYFCMREDLKFQSHTLEVHEAPEPSNIMFHHLSYPASRRTLRRCGTNLLTLLVISISVCVVFTALFFQTQNPQDTSCPPSVLQSEAASTTNENLRLCYCKQLGSDVLEEEVVDCDDWIRDWIVGRILAAVSALAIVVINYLLRVIIKSMVKWEKHGSVSGEEVAITIKLFVAQFLNTAIVLLVVNARFIGGGYDSFLPDWYMNVGASILYTMLLNAFNPLHLMPLIDTPIQQCRRKWLTPFVVTQDEMNRIYSGADLELSERYAHLLNTVFSCLFYSAGLPLLLPIAALTLCLSYWTDRVTVLRYYSKPPHWDHQLSSVVRALLPWALIIHMGISIWVYTSPPLASELNGSGAVTTAFGLGDYNYFDVSERIRERHVLPTFIALCLLLCYKLLQLTWQYLPFKCLSAVCDVDDEVHGTEKTYAEATQEVLLMSYRVEDQRLYCDAFLRTASMKQLKPEGPLLRTKATTVTTEAPGSSMPESAMERKVDSDEEHEQYRKSILVHGVVVPRHKGRSVRPPKQSRQPGDAEDRLASQLAVVPGFSDRAPTAPHAPRSPNTPASHVMDIVDSAAHPDDEDDLLSENIDSLSDGDSELVSGVSDDSLESLDGELDSDTELNSSSLFEPGVQDAAQYPIVDVTCPNVVCRQAIRVQDQGNGTVAMTYVCPFCQKKFVM